MTTDSNHHLRKYPNIIRELQVIRPEQIWGADITYVETYDGAAYLFLITDHYSKRIMGWQFARNMPKEVGIQALEMALKNRQYPNQDLIHHSDRGSQYCSYKYTDILVDNGIAISMTEKGDPYENAIAERLNGTIKYEFGMYQAMGTFTQTKAGIEEAVHLYNDYRRHHSNSGLTPNQMHGQSLLKIKQYGKRKNGTLATAPKEETGSAEEQPVSSMV
jgi:transposase InsO family protein